MEELFRIIEEKIKISGYPETIDACQFYDDVGNEAVVQENGPHLVTISKGGQLYYEASMDVMDDDFDLHFVDIHDGDYTYHVDFDS